VYISFGSQEFTFRGASTIYDADGNRVNVEAAALDLETGLIEQVQCVDGTYLISDRGRVATVSIFRKAPLCLVDASGYIMTAGAAPPDQVMGFAQPRSGRWPTVRKRHLEDFPACAACGVRAPVSVHHVIPFHVDPDRELDPSNLITLCETVGRSCHFVHGHGLDWRAYMIHVKVDTALMFQRLQDRLGVPWRGIKGG
jgi:5-methylcytosine-specific restriction protein A